MSGLYEKLIEVGCFYKIVQAMNQARAKGELYDSQVQRNANGHAVTGRSTHVWPMPEKITILYFLVDTSRSTTLHAMLSLSRFASKRIPGPFLRSFAQAVGPGDNSNLASEIDTSHRRRRRRTKKLGSTATLPSASSSTSKVAVREDHGLYAFFRRIPQKPDSPELVGEDKYEVVETPEEGQLITGLLFPPSLILLFY